MLEVLVAAEGGVVSAEERLARAWDENADPFTNAVRITVSGLRKRLGEPWIIATVAGVGYRIDEATGRGEASVDRAPGLSVRLKLTLSYAGFLMLAGAVLLAAGYFSLSRGVHPGVIFLVRSHADLLRDFTPIAAVVMAFLLVFGLLGGWLLAGRMLAPLTRITDATRMAATGSLAHRIELEGRQDEFRGLADSFDTMLARLEAHIAEQQRFAANASHELRTPLAITQTLLDVARNDPTATTTNSSTAFTRSTPGRSTSPKRCSCSAAPTSGRSPRNTSTCRSIAEEATETLLPLAEERGVTIETSGDAAASPRLTRAPAAVEREPRAERDRPQPAGTGHRVGRRPASTPRARCSPSRTPARSSRHSWSPRWPSRFSAAPNASAPTTQASASAWRSSRASPKRTTEHSPSRPRAGGGFASRCNYPPRHRTLADDDLVT